jgi:Retrotransposon gag protein
MTEPTMNSHNSHLPSQELTIDLTGVGNKGAGNVAAAGKASQSGEHQQQPAMPQPTLEQVVQMLWAERTQTQAQNQQLQQQLSQIQSEVHSQAIIQPSAQDFKYKPSTPDSSSGAASNREGWIDQVELHMDLARIPRTDDIFRLAVSSQFLGEQVPRWTRMQHDVSGWTDLNERMSVYYKVPNKDKNIRDDLNKLRQTGSVAKYTNRFNHLVLQVGEMSQADQAFHFVKGMKAIVKLEVEKEWV